MKFIFCVLLVVLFAGCAEMPDEQVCNEWRRITYFSEYGKIHTRDMCIIDEKKIERPLDTDDIYWE